MTMPNGATHRCLGRQAPQAGIARRRRCRIQLRPDRDFCSWHRRQGIQPPPQLPALRDGAISIETLRAWAAEFDTNGGTDLWLAADFVDWLAADVAAAPRPHRRTVSPSSSYDQAPTAVAAGAR